MVVALPDESVVRLIDVTEDEALKLPSGAIVGDVDTVTIVLYAALPPLSSTVTVIVACARILTERGDTVRIIPAGTGGGGLPIVKVVPALMTVTPSADVAAAVMVTIRLTAFALNLTVATPLLFVSAELRETDPAELLLTANDTVAPETTLFSESLTVALTVTDPDEGMDVTGADVATSVKLTVILAGVPVVVVVGPVVGL